MVFNVCPAASKYIRNRLIPSFPQVRIGTRRPMAERAREAREGRLINYFQAVDHWMGERFSLEGNRFSIDNKSKIVDGRTLALVISHFGSIADNSKITITVEDPSPTSFEISIKITDRDANHKLSVRIEVYCNNLIELSNIRSSASGYGGRGLAALHNFAKDINSREIIYIPKDNAARRFYYHMDFISRASHDSFSLKLS
jgi:hypothetical protein